MSNLLDISFWHVSLNPYLAWILAARLGTNALAGSTLGLSLERELPAEWYQAGSLKSKVLNVPQSSLAVSNIGPQVFAIG